jgi:hypothetical protein
VQNVLGHLDRNLIQFVKIFVTLSVDSDLP